MRKLLTGFIVLFAFIFVILIIAVGINKNRQDGIDAKEAQDAKDAKDANRKAETEAEAEAEAYAKAEAEVKAEIEAETEAEIEAEEKAKKKAEEKAKTKAEEKVEADAIAKAKAEADAIANIYSPFVAAKENTSTQAVWVADGNPIFLDRFNINCDDKGINRLQFIAVGDDHGKYEYNCADGGVLSTNLPYSTKQVNLDKGNITDLGSMDINCGKNKVLTSLFLQRGKNEKHQYNYNCAANKQSQKLKCRDVATARNDDGGGNLVFLDRHNIACNKNEVLSQLVLAHSPDRIQYHYTCCS